MSWRAVLLPLVAALAFLSPYPMLSVEGGEFLPAQVAAFVPDDVNWQNGFENPDPLPGFYGGWINACVTWRDTLFVGGFFSYSSSGPLANVAEWDGADWLPVGPGLSDVEITALTVYDSMLVAGGFRHSSPAGHIASWDGTAWTGLGGTNAPVRCLGVYDGKLIAGGGFTTAGGIAVGGIASWDGTSWSALGSLPSVSSLVISEGALVAGCTSGVYRWDGVSWSVIGSSFNGSVRALAVHGGHLHAGGEFTTIGGAAVAHIARWNGTEWEPVGFGFDESVMALASESGVLVAGGAFSAAGETGTMNIAVWDGTTWSPLGNGLSGGVRALGRLGGSLITAGTIGAAGEIRLSGIAAWDGMAWSGMGATRPPGNGVLGVPKAMIPHGNGLLVGGSLTRAGSVPCHGIAWWDGTSWEAFGDALSGTVQTLCEFNGEIYAGGFLEAPSGQSWRTSVYKWNGTAWEAFGGEFSSWGIPNNQFDPCVLSLAVHNGELYAGGYFYGSISRWTGSQWSMVGGGIGLTGAHGREYGHVYAVASYDGQLVTGGWFNDAGYVPVTNIAGWDGTAWHGFGAGLGVVECLKEFGGDLVAGVAVGASRWDGSAWSQMGSLFDSGVSALGAYQGSLIASGGTVARWDGSDWVPFGSGVSGWTGALCEWSSTLYVGGDFRLAGGKESWNIAAWSALPVAVELASLSAEMHEGRVVVRWSPASRNDPIEFDVYRGRGSNRTRLTPASIRNQPLCEFIDTAPCADSPEYWVRGLMRTGEARWFGPVTPGGMSPPPALTLLDVRPNPVHSRCDIVYSTPDAGRVLVTVHDAQGRMVAKPVDDEEEPGWHTVGWAARRADGTLLPSGLYLVRISMAGRGVRTAKFVLMR